MNKKSKEFFFSFPLHWPGPPMLVACDTFSLQDSKGRPPPHNCFQKSCILLNHLSLTQESKRSVCVFFQYLLLSQVCHVICFCKGFEVQEVIHMIVERLFQRANYPSQEHLARCVIVTQKCSIRLTLEVAVDDMSILDKVIRLILRTESSEYISGKRRQTRKRAYRGSSRFQNIWYLFGLTVDERELTYK